MNKRKQNSKSRIPGQKRNRPLVVLFANTSWYLWNFRASLAKSLVANDFDVVFLAPADNYSNQLAAIAPFVSVALDRKSVNPIGELLALVRTARLLRKIRPEVVLTWTPKCNIYGALVCRWLRIPSVPNVAGLGFAFSKRNWLAFSVAALYHFAFRACQTVFFQNAFDRDEFVESGRVNATVSAVLPGSGVDLAKFPIRPARNAPDFLFLFAGRLLRPKGLAELVRAAQSIKCKDRVIRIRVAGAVDPGNPASFTADEIRNWAEEGLIEFVGHTDDVGSLIADADCVVLPSYYREGVPRILLEAAASGRPVITTDAPGCRDAIVAEKTGFLCKPRNAESLAAAMRSMLAVPAVELAAMGRRAREHIEKNFSEEIVIKTYLTALRRAIMRGAAAARFDSDEDRVCPRHDFKN